MSTWTNKLRLLGVASLLSGCLGTGGVQAPPVSPNAPSGAPPTRMAVAGGTVLLAAPKGFCIDRLASRETHGAEALAVFSSCRRLGAGLFTPAPRYPALLTAAVSPPGRVIEIDDHKPALEAFFASVPGRELLSRAGRTETVVIHHNFAHDGVWYLHLNDSAPFQWGDVQVDYWRALLPVNGRMVTLSVLNPSRDPISKADGFELLQQFVTEMRQSSTKAEEGSI